MADDSVLSVVRAYLTRVAAAGIPVTGAVLFGSWARGEQTEDSDIDVLVLSPVFDQGKDRATVDDLWRLAWRIDSRLEPFAVGTREWDTDRASPLLAVAHREGVAVARADT